jgi:hypothetical protein
MHKIKIFLRNAGIAIMVLAFAIVADAYITRPGGEKAAAIIEAALFQTVPNAVLHYTFRMDGTLAESGSITEGSSPYFWLNSGAYLILKDGVGKTNHGALPASNKWRLAYASNNALDTANGYYPQNLFRLVTKSTWKDFDQSVRFRIDSINETDTPNRDGYSGILLMSRYRDSDNLYYAGIRMDGTAVIKKKYQGTYYTLASSGKLFNTSEQYNKDSNPNLLPEDKWMRLKTTVVDQNDGSTKIELWLDRNDGGTWERIASATDTSGTVKGPASAGIRTDYMDATFDDYTLTER